MSELQHTLNVVGLAARGAILYLSSRLMAMRNGVDERVKVEGWQVRVLSLNEDHGGGVVPREMDKERQTVVEVGEGNAVLGAHWLADNDLVNVIELIPILFPGTTEWESCSQEGEMSSEDTHPMSCWSFTSGSNFGPPGIARFRALAVKKDLTSKR